MQLRLARLCADCEEVHDGQHCPVCASETFAYLSRWVPARAGRPSPGAEAVRGGEHAPRSAVYSPPRARSVTTPGRLAAYGGIGLAIFGVAQWIRRGRDKVISAAEGSAGELK